MLLLVMVHLSKHRCSSRFADVAKQRYERVSMMRDNAALPVRPAGVKRDGELVRYADRVIGDVENVELLEAIDVIFSEPDFGH